MTKEYILNAFKDINYAYNSPSKYDDLSWMLDELIEDTIYRFITKYDDFSRVLDEIIEDAIHCFITKLHNDYAIDVINDMKGENK